MYAPLRRVQGEDGADRRIGYRGHMGVPSVQASPGDDSGKPCGLLGVAERGDLDVIESFQAAQGIVGVAAACVQRCGGHCQRGEDEGLPSGVEFQDEARDLGVRPGDGDKGAHVQDPRRRDGAAFLAHSPGRAAAWASTCASIRPTFASSARAAVSRRRSTDFLGADEDQQT